MNNNIAKKSTVSAKNNGSDPVIAFCALITAEGYSKHSQQKFGATARAFWAAMTAAKLEPIDLSDAPMEQLASQVIQSRSVGDRKHCRFRLSRFRTFLIENANAPKHSEPELNMSPRACLKREFASYLRVQRGLADRSIYDNEQFFERFMTSKFGVGLALLHKWGEGFIS